MKPELQHFTITPVVVPAGKESTVSVVGHGDYYRFFDDVTYTVTFCPREIPDTEIDEDFTLGGYTRNKVQAKPTDGVLTFSYCFTGEQEWEIVITADQEHKKHLNWVRQGSEEVWDLAEWQTKGVNLRMYSLLPDLYKKQVFRGDLHVHSDASDGQESPEMVCANYRRLGYDFLSLTDHHCYDSSLRAKEKMEELSTGFTVFPGEEVHNKYVGRFHIVNFNGKFSVNKKILADRESVKREVKELSKQYSNLSERDAEEVAWYRWITEEIRKSGGLSVLAHPYWSCRNCYNSPTHITLEVIKRGYYDIFEVLGGIKPEENNLQTALYQELRSQGYRIPIAGSTDSHSSTEPGYECCNIAATYVFAESADKIPEAIMNLQSVAVQQLPGQSRQIYGPFRLVKYAAFLSEYYFPLHDELCCASGVLLAEYMKGDTSLKSVIEPIEQKIAAFQRGFFGKNLDFLSLL